MKHLQSVFHKIFLIRCSNNYVIKLRSSLRKFYGHHHDLVNRCGISMSQMTTDMFHSSGALFTVLSSFMAYHCLCNMTVVISGTGTAYPSGAHEFTPGLQWGLCCSIFSFLCMFCRSLFVLLSFFSWPLCCFSFFSVRILITLQYLQTLIIYFLKIAFLYSNLVILELLVFIVTLKKICYSLKCKVSVSTGLNGTAFIDYVTDETPTMQEYKNHKLNLIIMITLGRVFDKCYRNDNSFVWQIAQ